MESVHPHRQFVIHYCLGRGGYGEVYRATMVSPGGLRSDVAVKLLRVDVGAADDAVRRLKDEGRLLGLLRHPGILRVFDLAVLDGRVGLVTEYIEGQDLGPLMEELPVRCLVEIVGVVAEVLDVAWGHRAGDGGEPVRLVHRDIKPSNLRVGRHGEVKVLDFGIARSTSEQVDREARTGTGSTVGSLAYMAPERFTRAPAAPAADVYGLGCVLYEGLARRRLFVDAVPVDMFRLAADPLAYAAHLDEAMAALPAHTDPELVDLLRRMLAHAPGQRPTAHDVRAACDQLVDRLPGVPLRKWVRDRDWPKAHTVPGFLDGRTITEGTMSSTDAIVLLEREDRSSETFRIDLNGRPPAPPTMPPERSEPAAVAPSRAPRRLTWLALASAVLAVGLVSFLVWPDRDPPVPPPAPVAPVPVPPAPAPVAPDPVPPTPVPAPEPVPVPVPVPVPTPTPVPVPVPVAPTPAPVVAPVPLPPPDPVPPPEVRYGTVRLETEGVTIELRGAAGTFGPGRVPAGGGYELWANFGQTPHAMGRYVDVLPDLQVTVRCNPLRQTCDVAP